MKKMRRRRKGEEAEEEEERRRRTSLQRGVIKQTKHKFTSLSTVGATTAGSTFEGSY